HLKFAPSVALKSSRMARSRSAADSTESASQPASLKVPPKPFHFLSGASPTVTVAAPVAAVGSPVIQYPSGPETTSGGRSTTTGAPPDPSGVPPAPVPPPVWLGAPPDPPP